MEGERERVILIGWRRSKLNGVERGGDGSSHSLDRELGRELVFVPSRKCCSKAGNVVHLPLKTGIDPVNYERGAL